MKDVAGEGRTVIFVSHDLAAVRKLCNRRVLLEHWEIIYKGDTQKVLDKYNQRSVANKDFINSSWNKELDYDIKSIKITNIKLESKHIFSVKDKVAVKFDFHIKENASDRKSTRLN